MYFVANMGMKSYAMSSAPSCVYYVQTIYNPEDAGCALYDPFVLVVFVLTRDVHCARPPLSSLSLPLS